MIKENKKDERLKNGTNHGYKVYVQWTTVHVGVLFFFFFLSIEQYVLFDIFQYIYQGHVWYHCGLHTLRVCCLYTMINNSHLHMHVGRPLP